MYRLLLLNHHSSIKIKNYSYIIIPFMFSFNCLISNDATKSNIFITYDSKDLYIELKERIKQFLYDYEHAEHDFIIKNIGYSFNNKDGALYMLARKTLFIPHQTMDPYQTMVLSNDQIKFFYMILCDIVTLFKYYIEHPIVKE